MSDGLDWLREARARIDAIHRGEAGAPVTADATGVAAALTHIRWAISYLVGPATEAARERLQEAERLAPAGTLDRESESLRRGAEALLAARDAARER